MNNAPILIMLYNRICTEEGRWKSRWPLPRKKRGPSLPIGSQKWKRVGTASANTKTRMEKKWGIEWNIQGGGDVPTQPSTNNNNKIAVFFFCFGEREKEPFIPSLKF